MNIDKFSSRERMEKLYTGQAIDRIPFISSATMYSGTLANLTSEEFFYNPEKSFYAQKLARELHGCDGSPSFDFPGWIGLDMGGQIIINNLSGISVPKLKHAISNISDAYNFVLPDVVNGLGFQKRFEFYKIAYQHNLGVSIPAGSPMEVVGRMVDISLLMRWLYKEPDLVHHLLRLATDYLLISADAYIKEFGAQNCTAASNYPLDSNTIMSPNFFEKFSLPYIVEIYEKFKEKGISKFSIHLCGDQNLNIGYFKDLSLPLRSFISVDEKTDITLVAKTFGSDYIIGGNLATSIIRSGTPKEVLNESQKIINKMKYHKGGFVLMPSCVLPLDTPPLNLYAMLKACKEFGQY